MTGNWISLLLLSFSLSLQLQNGLSQFWKSEIGRLERDGNRQQYYVGEILTLHCYKFSDFVGDVSFAFANTAVSSHNVTVVNSTYARMDKLVTATDFAETNYQCIDGNGLIGSLGPTYIDYRPRNATDLQLVWLNKSSIDLSWGFDGLHYKNAHSQSLVRVTVHWRTSSENSGLDWQVCDESTNTSCSVYRFTDSHASLIVRVSLTIVKRNDTVSTVFSPVSLIAHAKPAAVKSVSVRALNSTAVVLTTSASWQPLNYTISYSTTAQYLKDGGMMVTGLTNQTSWTIGGLHPHYTYRITVRARFEQGYWSDPTSSALLQMPEAGTV